MAKLVADKVRIEHGLTINEKIIPWGAKWTKTAKGFKVGDNYKADRKLSKGTGIVKGITIHNTADLKSVEEDAEQYTRATYPNQNMNDARVHYYIDDINAWQNLREDEVGWHAGDGLGEGNETTVAIEIIMDGSGSKEDMKSEDNGALLAAILLVKHNLTIDKMYPHKKWSDKQCPLYILPHWDIFKAKVEANIKMINEEQKKGSAIIQKDWKEQSFDVLVEKGVITDTAYWKKRMNENITVGDVIGLLGKTVQKI